MTRNERAPGCRKEMIVPSRTQLPSRMVSSSLTDFWPDQQTTAPPRPWRQRNYNGVRAAIDSCTYTACNLCRPTQPVHIMQSKAVD